MSGSLVERYGSYKPEDKKAQVRARLDAEFEVYAEEMYASTRRDFEAMVDLGLAEPGEVDQAVDELRAEFEGLDFKHKVSKIANNFFNWWPGGWYRTKLGEKLAERESGIELEGRLAFESKLVVDLDDAIHKSGYDNKKTFELVQTKNLEGEEGDKRAGIVADTFFQLCDMGYDNTELRT